MAVSGLLLMTFLTSFEWNLNYCRSSTIALALHATKYKDFRRSSVFNQWEAIKSFHNAWWDNFCLNSLPSVKRTPIPRNYFPLYIFERRRVLLHYWITIIIEINYQMIARMILINKTRKRIAARCSTCFVFIGYFQESSPRTASSITTKKKKWARNKDTRKRNEFFNLYNLL